MRATALLLFALPFAASAQDWALINPAYKYNYSNDGSDTISNQIFVTQIDTLGPDSFRYELNRIGVVCDTCPASLGGPCDGCYVRTDQPQFLGLNCIRSGGDWIFIDLDTILIRSPANVGTSWVFSSSNGVTAMVDGQWPDSVFDMPDTLRRILLSTGDTLLFSRSYGILTFGHGGGRYDMIGVEGAAVGRLFPDPLAYFDYQPGDQLIYKMTSMYWVTTEGGPQFPFALDSYWMAVITGRTGSADTVDYTTSVALSYPSTPPGYFMSYLDQGPNWPMPLDHWSINRIQILADHPILAAYPGQVMDTSICWPIGSPGYDARYLVRHGITTDGRTIMRSQSLGQAFGSPTSGFDTSQEVAPGVYPFMQQNLLNVWYEEGVGIRRVEFKVSWMGLGELGVQLVGAVIGGDTILQPPVMDWDVRIEGEYRPEFDVFPNPAGDILIVRGARGGKTLIIRDLEGRLVRTAGITSTHEAIDVSDLNVGMYMLRIEGMAPHRLMITR